MDDDDRDARDLELLHDRVVRLLEERDRLTERVGRLEVSLRDAIRNTTRVRRQLDADPAGNTYGFEWIDDVREWADLCGLDLTGMTPEAYGH